LVVVDECSLVVLPSGEPSLVVEDDDECSVVVTGGGAAGATTTGAGATITGAGYTVTTFGGGAGASSVVTVVVLSDALAVPMAVLPNSIPVTRIKATIFDESFILISPLSNPCSCIE
jgi:hypothetical protein